MTQTKAPDGLIRSITDRIRYQLLGSKDPARTRVICVGMSKTATTTICDALDLLGYRAIHYAPIARMDAGKPQLTWPWWMNKYDAMADITVAAVYRELHALFPTATFILTFRAEDAWLKSCAKHFTAAKIETVRRESGQGAAATLDLNRYMLGANVFEPETFLAHYRRHNAEVREHFRGNPRFFEMDLTTGQGWAPLCEAVGKPVPATPFPQSNKRDIAWGAQAAG